MKYNAEHLELQYTHLTITAMKYMMRLEKWSLLNQCQVCQYISGMTGTMKDISKAISAIFPFIWRHGDWIEINSESKGLTILGRSDATLNRQGIRIGTAEIYRAVDMIDEVKDCLIVNLEFKNGDHYMPLFVVLKEGFSLTDQIVRYKEETEIRI